MNSNYTNFQTFSFLLFFVFLGKISIAQNNYTDSLQVDNISFQYLDAKLKLSYQDSQENFKAKVRLRMQQNERIWISISKTNVEGLRMLIKTDSILIMDRMNKTFQILTFEELSKKLSMDLNFQLLQAILIGNYSLVSEPINELEETEDFFIIKQPYARLDAENHIAKSNRKLQKLKLKDQVSNSSLDLNYENFDNFDVGNFPLLLNILLQYTDEQTLQNLQTQVSLEYQSVEFGSEPLQFPFNVSDKYARK